MCYCLALQGVSRCKDGRSQESALVSSRVFGYCHACFQAGLTVVGKLLHSLGVHACDLSDASKVRVVDMRHLLILAPDVT